MQVRLNEKREWVSQKPKSYEEQVLITALDVVRELVHVLKHAQSGDENRDAQNVNRAYSALDHLGRIERAVRFGVRAG